MVPNATGRCAATGQHKPGCTEQSTTCRRSWAEPSGSSRRLRLVAVGEVRSGCCTSMLHALIHSLPRSSMNRAWSAAVTGGFYDGIVTFSCYMRTQPSPMRVCPTLSGNCYALLTPRDVQRAVGYTIGGKTALIVGLRTSRLAGQVTLSAGRFG